MCCAAVYSWALPDVDILLGCCAGKHDGSITELMRSQGVDRSLMTL